MSLPPLSAVLSVLFAAFLQIRLPLLKYRILVGSFADLARLSAEPVSYTHLDVYKRQIGRCEVIAPSDVDTH